MQNRTFAKPDRKPSASPPRQKIARGALLRAGAGYGLLFGLGFALFVWGYDALALNRSSADMAWAKLLLGLPCLLVSGGVAGIVGAWSSSTLLTTLVWAAAFGGIGWLAGIIPFTGMNWLAGILDPRFAGLTPWPYTEGSALRTLLVVIAYTQTQVLDYNTYRLTLLSCASVKLC